MNPTRLLFTAVALVAASSAFAAERLNLVAIVTDDQAPWTVGQRISPETSRQLDEVRIQGSSRSNGSLTERIHAMRSASSFARDL